MIRIKIMIQVCLLCLMPVGLAGDQDDQKKELKEGEAKVLPLVLEEMVVSVIREAQARWQAPMAVGTVSEEEVRRTQPAHPTDIMGRISGTWVNITGGEGHMTAIRQPLTTNPVYLFLENGIPTRSTGFFNHNALYEVNLPMAGNIEVIKGPGSALHGSDAIGGVIQVNTRRPPQQREFELGLEGGEQGWKRGLFSMGDRLASGGYRLDVNLTDSEGWRDGTDYQRQAGTFQWERAGADTRLLAMVTFSTIDQNTAGSSAISEEDYLNNPTVNYTPISLRNVDAFRASVKIERDLGRGSLSLIPYARSNAMTLLPNWSLTYDPTLYEVQNNSAGMLARYRYDWDRYDAMLILGADLDYSPGERMENRLDVVREQGIFTRYTMREALYDYDVTFQGVSAYVHSELSPTDRVRLSLGTRYDRMAYDYDTRLDPVQTGRWRRPAGTEIDYDQVSPKIGLSWLIASRFNLFTSYRHAFRAPSEGQLFRQGSTDDTLGLEPVKAANTELGIRGAFWQRLGFQLSLYRLIKKDDILRYDNPDNGLRESVNAGRTSHEGIELDVQAELASGVSLRVAASQAEHRYEDWLLGERGYSGNEMEFAPRFMGNVNLAINPERLNNLRVDLEWRRLGSYYMDPANAEKYDGHDLINGRVSYQFGKSLLLGLRMRNLSDERYAERASYNRFRGREFAPGLPRTLSLSLRYRWE